MIKSIINLVCVTKKKMFMVVPKKKHKKDKKKKTVCNWNTAERYVWCNNE